MSTVDIEAGECGGVKKDPTTATDETVTLVAVVATLNEVETSPVVSEAKLETPLVAVKNSSRRTSNDEEQAEERLLLQAVPSIKFRDVVFTKKFGSSPYDADR